MEFNNIITILMIVSLFGFLLIGFPVAFTLAGTAILFAGIGSMIGYFDLSFFGALPSRIYGAAMTNEVLIAVPLFVFMGVMLERSKVAEELLETMGDVLSGVKGGLGISVCVVGALMAASTGIVGATVVTMGLMSLPTMLKRGYNPALACGTICASGTLGQIIPPSIVLILLGDQISNSYVDAQRSLGNWSPDPVSVGDLFAGALIPSLILVALYIFYQQIIARLRPDYAPVFIVNQSDHSKLYSRVLKALVPPIILIIAVLGSIITGVATPTEAAAIGAVGSILLAAVRISPEKAILIYIAGISLIIMVILANGLDLRFNRNQIPVRDLIGIITALICFLGVFFGLLMSLLIISNAADQDSEHSILQAVMISTMRITTMVFTILIGASIFTLVFRGFGGDDLIHGALSHMPGGVIGAVIIVMLVMFVLGFFLDFIEITFVVVPLVAPILFKMGINPIWLGVMMAMNLQTSFLTPPFGFSLFFLRGVAPPSVKTAEIYKGAIPFVVIQLIGLGLLALFPILATGLPQIISK
jgi:tripartite ATP-independent transporter DctM subunit